MLNLPLDQEGAYLVVARGNHLYASGLVLVSPLELDVREDAAAGRVRVTVQDAVAGSCSSKVLVKVIGSQNDGFTTDETDLRGLFVANNIRGLSTVIAQADGGRYAFHRGTLALGPTPSDAPPPDAVFELPAAAPEIGVELELLRHNSINSNGAIQLDNRARFEKLLINTNQGIPAEAANGGELVNADLSTQPHFRGGRGRSSCRSRVRLARPVPGRLPRPPATSGEPVASGDRRSSAISG